MGGITVKPEHKPEHLGNFQEIGFESVWLGFSGFGVNPHGQKVENTPQTVWRRN